MKFSELTIDMFRMLQALEREPVNLATQTTKPGTLVREDSCTLPISITVECSLSSLFSPLLFITFTLSHFLSLSSLSFSRSLVKSQPSERTLTNTFYTNPPSANFTPSFRPPSRSAHISCTHHLYFLMAVLQPVCVVAAYINDPVKYIQIYLTVYYIWLYIYLTVYIFCILYWKVFRPLPFYTFYYIIDLI